MTLTTTTEAAAVFVVETSPSRYLSSFPGSADVAIRHAKVFATKAGAEAAGRGTVREVPASLFPFRRADRGE